MSASIAQTWTSLPEGWRTGASGVVGPTKREPGLLMELAVRSIQKVFARLDLTLGD